MQKSLRNTKPFTVLTLILIHTSGHAFVELITVNIFSGTPQRAGTTHNSCRSTKSFCFWRSMKHMHRILLIARPSSCSRPKTNSMSAADRVGRKPPCVLGSIPLASQFWLRRDATIVNT